MSGILDVLERLQELDARITNLQKLRIDLPTRIGKLKAVIDQEEQDLERLRKLHEGFLTQQKSLEQESEIGRDKLLKAEDKLNHITNNTEYQAALKEIKNLKQSNDERDTGVLSYVEKIESAEKAFKTEEEKFNAHMKEYQEQKSEVDKRLASIDDEVKRQEETRNAIASDIPRPILGKYDRIRKFLDGVAVAQVVGGICQACHRALTPQKTNLIRRGDEIFQCEHCRRLMVFKS